jgi:hypothetical protein
MRVPAAIFCLLIPVLQGCGGDSPTGPEVKTETFTFSLTDPDRCNCGNGIAQYTIEVAESGTLEATATWTPADAVVVVRLLDANFTNVFATSTPSGTTARLSQAVTRGTYRIQVFLAPTGGRNASYQLTVTHP